MLIGMGVLMIGMGVLMIGMGVVSEEVVCDESVVISGEINEMKDAMWLIRRYWLIYTHSM